MKIQTGISIDENIKLSMSNNIFYSGGRNNFSASVEYTKKGLDFLTDGIINNLKGVFTFEELSTLTDIIHLNKQKIIKEVHSSKYHNGQPDRDKMNIYFFIRLSNLITENDGLNKKILFLDLSKKVLEIEEYKLFALISALYNSQEEGVSFSCNFDLAKCLLSDEEYNEHFFVENNQNFSNNIPIPEEFRKNQVF